MQNTDLEQKTLENITPQELKNAEEIRGVQKSFQTQILLSTLWLLQYTRELLGILPEKKHPSEIVEMLAKKRAEALSTLGDDAENDDDFKKAA